MPLPPMWRLPAVSVITAGSFSPFPFLAALSLLFLAFCVAHTVVLWWITHGGLASLALVAVFTIVRVFVATWRCPLHDPMEGYMLVWHYASPTLWSYGGLHTAVRLRWPLLRLCATILEKRDASRRGAVAVAMAAGR